MKSDKKDAERTQKWPKTFELHGSRDDGIASVQSLSQTTPPLTGTISEPKLVLVPTSPAVQEQKKASKLTIDFHKKWKSFQKWRSRPGVQFRVRLGAITAAALAVTSLLVPKARILAVTQRWVSHRGFQGIAALGRTIAYLWALLVGYPRVLDRRANERKRQRQDQALERRREQLHRLAGEVARLRQELASLDAEIRAFRREIISLKAYAKDDSDIQEAIGAEMAHLAQLRSNTQAALSAARQTWAEFRSKSPPEIWDDSLVP